MTITPIAVTPSVAPIARADCVNAVADPMARIGTWFWTATTKTCIIIPSPTPATTMYAAACALVVDVSIRESRKSPVASTTGPTSAFGR